MTMDEIAVLAKGIKFAIILKSVSAEAIIANIGTDVQRLPQEIAKETRHVSARIL